MTINNVKGLATVFLLMSLASLGACGGDTVRSESGVASSSGAAMVDVSGGLAYQSANGITGGQLYSRFWASETDFSLNNSQLDNQGQLDSVIAKENFFRCVQCHGWDRLGRQGGYSNRAPSTSRPRVADVDLARISAIASPQALFDSIKSGGKYRSVTENLDSYDPDTNASIGDKMPNYSEILTDAQIWDIVKFLKEEALDTTALYDLVLLGDHYPQSRGFLNIGVGGSPTAGDVLYAENCSLCHGIDGTERLVDKGSYTVGRYMRSKPFQGQHKVKFGHLGSPMGPVLKKASLDDIQDLFAAMSNADKYPDAKPEPQPEPEPIDGVLAFLKHCSGCHSGAGEGSDSPRYGDVTGASATLISSKIQSEPKMHHLKPDDPAQAASPEEVLAIAEFLGG